MTNPAYKGTFKKEPLTLGLPVLDKDIIRAYMSEMGKRSVKKQKRTRKDYRAMALKRWKKV
jgi:hypothetical protein